MTVLHVLQRLADGSVAERLNYTGQWHIDGGQFCTRQIKFFMRREWVDTHFPTGKGYAQINDAGRAALLEMRKVN